MNNFQFRALANPWSQTRPPLAANPMIDLLRSLRGRQVAVLVDGHRIVGRVLTLEPLVLVGTDGTATSLLPDEIHSVQF